MLEPTSGLPQQEEAVGSSIQRRISRVRQQHNIIAQQLCQEAGLSHFSAQCLAWEAILDDLIERFDHGKL
jgi:hypothetical protein